MTAAFTKLPAELIDFYFVTKRDYETGTQTDRRQ